MPDSERESASLRAYELAYQLFRCKGLSETDSEDLAMEVVYRVLSHIDQGKPLCDKWIRTVAQNLLNDYWRHQRSEQEMLSRYICVYFCGGGGRFRGGVVSSFFGSGSVGGDVC